MTILQASGIRKSLENHHIYIIFGRELLVHEKEQGTPKDLDRFTETVNMCRRRHLDIVPKMAQAVFKLKHVNSSEGVTETVQYFLDRLYINRLDRRNKRYRLSIISCDQDFYPHADIPLQCTAW